MLIECKNLICGYDKNPLDNPVIKDISFSVREGESVAILGANGCGKTTLIRAICGMLPYAGNVHVDGREVRTMKRKDIAGKLSVLMQFSNVYFSYTVEETVMLGRYLYSKNIFGLPGIKDREIVNRCLNQYGLDHERDRQISQLSGGQLQRVFLARTMAQDTDIIVLDEPTNHLDIKYQSEFLTYLSDWKNEDKKHTLIGVFHDINIAIEAADKLILLKDGEILADGSKAEIISSEFLRKTFDIDVKEYMKKQYSHWI
ncbi:MAG: ABC transporter ATP-binding protein [Butyrivibrio sp.]|uniref:ABC transporter ATP-binding protein n=1 Tax=Butyrivibrio sp. TaxID=28121 RepID=UPI001B236062|nr:ABC transporter ATP-binding protein [Butyrivibrio sp.]MBO6240801.1 ABC transporter ATP-binding protein [Butyrivibrio sp.]